MRLGLFLDVVGSGGIGWTPANLGASLFGWWDAESTGLVTQVGGAVSSWKDAIAGYDAVQVTGASKPTYSASSFNGRPGITFDGVDDYLGATTTLAFPTGAALGELWALVNQTALGADATARTALAYGDPATANRFRKIQRIGSTGINRAAIRTGDGATSVQTISASAGDFSGYHVERGIFTATAQQADLDGTAGTSGAVVPSTLATIVRLGARETSTAAEFFQGSINSLLVTGPLDAGQAALLYTYLKARGGIA